jgi:aminopeptidase N
MHMQKTSLVAAVVAGVMVAGSGVALAAPVKPTPGAPGAGDPYYPDYGNGGYDVAHYGLKLRYVPKSDRLSGTAVVTARATKALSSFNLDFALKVSSVKVNGKRAKFRASGAHELVITPKTPLKRGQKIVAEVTYAGVPSQVKVNGITSWQRTPDGAVAANEPESAWWWFPSNDHPTDKATYDVSVTVPKGLQVISNGRQVGQRTKKGWTRFDWREARPQATYLATVAVGKFDVTRGRTKGGLPFINAYSKGLSGEVRKNAQASLGRTAEVIDWESRVFGRYPFDAVGGYVPNVTAGFAIETQTRPFYSPKFFAKGPRLSVVVHENAHQWFGDSVSVHSWRDIWLNEGFATYAEWLWDEQHGGPSAQEWAEKTYAQYPANDKFWQVKPGDPGAADPFHDAVYDRGALAVHALRKAVGDKAFFKILKTWTAARGGRDASIAQFIAHAERVSGKQLDGVFTTWLYTPGRPAL